MDAFETFEVRGMTCELHPDEMAMSPADWDNLGTLVNFDRDAPGESQPYSIVGNDVDATDRGGSALLVRYLRLTRDIIAVPFYFADYGSSGARIWAVDADEQSPSGYIYTTHARVTELCGDGTEYHSQEWIEDALRSELKTWSDYVEGNVYGYIVRDPEGEIVDSVWGFYPDDRGDGLDELRAEARAAAEAEAEIRAKAEAGLNAGRDAMARSLRQAHITSRLEALRRELRAECISYGELAELQGLAEYIDPSDAELREAAGLPEHGDDV